MASSLKVLQLKSITFPAQITYIFILKLFSQGLGLEPLSLLVVEGVVWVDARGHASGFVSLLQQTGFISVDRWKSSPAQRSQSGLFPVPVCREQSQNDKTTFQHVNTKVSPNE